MSRPFKSGSMLETARSNRQRNFSAPLLGSRGRRLAPGGSSPAPVALGGAPRPRGLVALPGSGLTIVSHASPLPYPFSLSPSLRSGHLPGFLVAVAQAGKSPQTTAPSLGIEPRNLPSKGKLHPCRWMGGPPIGGSAKYEGPSGHALPSSLGTGRFCFHTKVHAKRETDFAHYFSIHF